LNFGTNGFLNTLETVADNGIYNGYYPYDFAIDATIKACKDSDADGVPDVSDLDDEFGTFGDDQAPNAFSIYGSIVTDMFLLKLKPVVEQHTGLQLAPNYSYLRIYINGNDLKKHKDRPECEISTTLHLGGDTEWPIFLGDQKIDLNKGDMLIYRGCDFVHWREPYKGITYCQTFLHYSDVNGPLYKGINFDERPHLGLPAWFKNK
jgi:hypothetical protein